MRRLLEQDLLDWKRQTERKPILIDGARQVGKSYLVENLFGKENFERVIKLDFLAEPSLVEIFEDSLRPKNILDNIEIRFSLNINLDEDLIFFDEVGECQKALEALKYFSEELPEAYICATGSNIGLIRSFPVGKVQMLELFPMCFEEFLMATGNTALLDAYRSVSRKQIVHSQLWAILLDYYFVGGMPEAVMAWYMDDENIHEKCQQVIKIHQDLITGYQRDFGKYNGAINAQHIDAVFMNVPRQLSKSVDGSVNRFMFKSVIEKKQRYRELRGPIDWLEKTKLVSKCYPVSSKPRAPLAALAKENIFKLFLFDVGLLGYLLQMSYKDQLAQDISYKGFIAENFVQNELRSRVSYPLYSWEYARSEIEFLHKCENGEIIPVEVKSGARTRAKSLGVYVDRYAPPRTVKLIGAQAGDPDQHNIVWPLYYAQFLRRL